MVFVWEFDFWHTSLSALLLSRSVITRLLFSYAYSIVFLLFIQSNTIHKRIHSFLLLLLFFAVCRLRYCWCSSCWCCCLAPQQLYSRTNSVCLSRSFVRSLRQFLYQFVYLLCIIHSILSSVYMHEYIYFAFQRTYGLFVHIHYSTLYVPIVTFFFIHSILTQANLKTDSCTLYNVHIYYHMCELYACVHNVRCLRECAFSYMMMTES